MIKEQLTPPDLKQCQCEKPNRNTPWTFGGAPGFVRCEEKPVVIVIENTRKKKKGSTALCKSCWGKLIELHGEKYATAKPILDHGGVNA